MKACKIADKIICSMCRDFIEHGNQFSCASKLVTLFPKEPPHLVHAAIRMLDSDGLLSVAPPFVQIVRFHIDKFN